MKTNPNKLWILVIALGWLFDFLFWKRSLASTLPFLRRLVWWALLSSVERRASPESHQLDPASAIRLFRRCYLYPRRADDNFPRLHLYTFWMTLLAVTYLGGHWYLYTLADYIGKSLQYLGA